MTTEPDALENLPAALDWALFERGNRGRFHLLGQAPAWLALEAPLDASGGIDLADRYPLLELFLADCIPVFEDGGPRRMESDVWEEHGAAGSRQYLQATAMRLGSRCLLALKALPEERFTYQQLSHEFQLAQEEAERQRAIAERATRAKSDFLAMMSHEIRTPLNSIIGMADVLGESPLNEDQRRCVEIFQRNGVHLLNLINDILDLAKVESGKVELELARFDLRDTVARAAEVIDLRARAKGLALETEVSPHIPAFYMGDASRLRQVLINLLGNSIKFTEQGRLMVRVEQDPGDPTPGSLRFAVSDTGIGIPEEKLAQVFESFSQADTSTTRKYGGTGLGLSISRQFVELMGGRIWVESKLGEGSTFFFTVKLAVDADQAAEDHVEGMPQAAMVSAVPERRVDGLRILLVDDSPDNRFLISSYLKDALCAIETAENGEEAVERFRGAHYDVVLMDVEMPVMDGYTATREIRKIEGETGAPTTPVVALTAHLSAKLQAEWEQTGFSGYLTKPIRKAMLIDALADSASLARAMEIEAEQQQTRPTAEPSLRVTVEKGMEDVVPGYIERRRQDIPLYRQALAEADFDTVRTLGHRMRGTGGGYGLPLLSQIGGEIEDAALSGDAAEIAAAVDRFAVYVETVQLDYAE